MAATHTGTVAVVITATDGADTSARIIDRRQLGVIAAYDPNRRTQKNKNQVRRSVRGT
jgi:hypothetical protein